MQVAFVSSIQPLPRASDEHRPADPGAAGLRGEWTQQAARLFEGIGVKMRDILMESCKFPISAELLHGKR